MTGLKIQIVREQKEKSNGLYLLSYFVISNIYKNFKYNHLVIKYIKN